jgi:hypothetical protein
MILPIEFDALYDVNRDRNDEGAPLDAPSVCM